VFAWQIIWITTTVLFAIDKKPLSYFKTYKTVIRNKLDELRDIFLSKNLKFAKLQLIYKNNLYLSTMNFNHS